MMQLYSDAGSRIGTLTGYKGAHTVHALQYDEKTLKFKYPTNGALFDSLKHEAEIRTKTDAFVVKSISSSMTEGWVDVEAYYNVEDIESCVFLGGCEWVEKTMPEVLEEALKGSGWAVGACDVMKRRTIRIEGDTDAWGILKQCVSTYRAEIEVDTLHKVVTIHEARGSDRGVFYREGLNLEKLECDSDTYGFFTQLIAVGKDGMQLWDETGNTQLVLENFSYSTKRVLKVWRDERYTNTTSLKEDALAKLAEACKPYTAYKASVKDLAKHSDHPEFFSYGVGDTVRIVSKTSRVKEVQRVASVDEYEDQTDNVVEISNSTASFAQIQKDEQEVAKTEAIDIAKRYTTQKVTGFVTTEEVTTAIRATQEAIELEAAQTYTTIATTEEYAEQARSEAKAARTGAEAAAKEMADQALQDASDYAKGYTDGVLVNYSATVDVESMIRVATDAITLEVSTTYATQETVQQVNTDAQAAAQAAQDTAQQYTDTVLVDYSTTIQMDAAIKLAQDAITLAVSETYATTANVQDALGNYSTTETVQKEISSAMKITKDAIDMDFINGQISSKTQFSVDGLTITGGGIKILNEENTPTFYSDTDGNTYASRLGDYRYKKFFAEIGSKEMEYVSYDADGNATSKKTNAPGAFFTYTDSSETEPVFGIRPNGVGGVYLAARNGTAFGVLDDTNNRVTRCLSIGENYASLTNKSNNRLYLSENNAFIQGIHGYIGSRQKEDGTAENYVFTMKDEKSGWYAQTWRGLNTRMAGPLEVAGNLQAGWKINATGNIYTPRVGTFELHLKNSADGTADDVENLSDYWVVYAGSTGATMVATGSDQTFWCGGSCMAQISQNAGRLYVWGGIACSGEKSRAVRTEHFGTLLQNAYETAEPYFGDIGGGTIGDDGTVTVFLDDAFMETVSATEEYRVFLQKEGPGDLWVEEKTQNFFTVAGTPGLKFAWEIKSKQRGYELTRLEETDTPQPQQVDDCPAVQMEPIQEQPQAM